MEGANVVGGTRWSTEEDVQLCKSWKFVSQCSIAGVNRKKPDLWSEVLKHYNENGFHRTSTQSLIGRWKLLKGEMYVWCCALRQAREWQCSGSNPLNERDKAQEIWQYIMSKKHKDKPKVTKRFSYFEQYKVVEGFSQFVDIPTNMASSGGTTAGGSEGIHTQSSPTNSQVNLDNDENEIAEDVHVRPPGRKAAKEAIRKGKKAANDGSPMASAVMSIAANQTSMLSYREKRDEEYARLLQEQENRENIRLQMKMRNEAFKLQEREERIMEMDTSKMTPTKKSYWQRKQKVIAAREENASSGSYYPQPSFPRAFPQPPFTGAFPQPNFAGAFPQPTFPGASHNQLFPVLSHNRLSPVLSHNHFPRWLLSATPNYR
ncbi:hypothetical protein M0R45_001355 [Rubus argutus]|uniref:No apical meristem-associated C-terminal domain-containing protein n=1 Tax=Rubus argutus TaxID=59490 RepID=A0AAW1VMF7_RUBAR